jgi:hypothetical protein
MYKVELKLSRVLPASDRPAEVEIVITTKKSITDVIDLSHELLSDGLRLLWKPIYSVKSTTPPELDLTELRELKESLLDSVKQFTDVLHMENSNDLHVQRAGTRHKVTYTLVISKVESVPQAATPLWGNATKNSEFCRCEKTLPQDCGCAFGQCAKSLIY